MSECSHNCSSCGENCEKRDLHVSLRPGSSVKKVIGIVSGKGGVGKSLVTSDFPTPPFPLTIPITFFTLLPARRLT